MAETEPPVIGVIPHYNDAQNLDNLLGHLSGENYTHIYVIDDASTGEQRDYFETIAGAVDPSEVTIIRNDKNVGAGAARNRILEQDKVMADERAILHFLDSDVQPETLYLAETAQDVMTYYPGVAMMGGLVNTAEGRQMPWNYGPRFSAAAAVGSILQLKADSLMVKNGPEEAAAFRQRFDRWLKNWPDTTKRPERAETFWVSEANLLISAAHLMQVGGFMNRRFHDVQGVAIKLHEAGLKTRFEPAIAVTHLSNESTPTTIGHQLGASLQLIRDHGLRNFLLKS